jgi:hypothetical protein
MENLISSTAEAYNHVKYFKLCQNRSWFKSQILYVEYMLFQGTHIKDAQTQCSGIIHNLIPFLISMITPGPTIFV